MLEVLLSTIEKIEDFHYHCLDKIHDIKEWLIMERFKNNLRKVKRNGINNNKTSL